jgi:hypothetical protein
MIKVISATDRSVDFLRARQIFLFRMKFIVIPILLLLIMTQTFSKWFVVMAFNLNREYIAKNLCENRYRPQLNCKGNCVLMKKMKQEEKQEQDKQGPVKIEINSVVLSSKSFFASAEMPVFITAILYTHSPDSGKPVDRPATFFHPPSA